MTSLAKNAAPGILNHAAPAPEVRLVAVGDICLSRGVKKNIEKYGVHFVFEKVKPLLQKGDIVFGNLECVVAQAAPAAHPGQTDMLVPAFCAEAVAAAGFSILNIANNHIMDYGPEALQETAAFLETKNILHVGAGGNEREARSPVVIEKNGIKTGMLGYADNSTGHPSRKNPSAGKWKPGIAAYDEKKILNDLLQLKEKTDAVIISLHADLEFAEYPAPSRVRFCRSLIDNGARIILQHHPHVPQGIELYKEGLIAYSLGNFVFPAAGNDYLLANSDHCAESFILDVRFDAGKIVDLQIIPVRITRDHRPEPLTGEEGRRLTHYITSLSPPLHCPAVLADLGFKTSLAMLRKTLNQMKTGLLKKNFSGVVRMAVSLFKTSEHRRWIKALLLSLLTRPFRLAKATAGHGKHQARG